MQRTSPGFRPGTVRTGSGGDTLSRIGSSRGGSGRAERPLSGDTFSRSRVPSRQGFSGRSLYSTPRETIRRSGRGGGDYWRHKDQYYESYHRYRHNYHHSGWGFYVGWDWGFYFGRYDWRHYPSYGYHYYRPWSLWWPDPVCVAYVPYGFYVNRPTVLVRQVVVEEVPVVIREEVPVYVREEAPISSGAVVVTGDLTGGVLTGGEEAALEDGPPSFDATTERYLREGSDAFANADYRAAAEAFRTAAIANIESAAPRFAFGQALIALGDYPYAAKVLRAALAQEPNILRAPGSIVGVYRDAAEFERVLGALKSAHLANPGDSDLVFLILYQQYFSGDPSAQRTLTVLRSVDPVDPAVSLFGMAMEERFSGAGDLPPSSLMK